MMNCDHAKLEIETDYFAKTNGEYSSDLQKHLFVCRSCRNHGIQLTRILRTVQMEPFRPVGVDLAHYTALAIADLPRSKPRETTRRSLAYLTALAVLFLLASGTAFRTDDGATSGEIPSAVSFSLLAPSDPILESEHEIENREESLSCLSGTQAPDFSALFADLSPAPIASGIASRKRPPVGPDAETTNEVKTAFLEMDRSLRQEAPSNDLYSVEDIVRLLSATNTRNGTIVPLGEALGELGAANQRGGTAGSLPSEASARAMGPGSSGASTNDAWIRTAHAQNQRSSVSEDPTLTPLGAYCLADLLQ